MKKNLRPSYFAFSVGFCLSIFLSAEFANAARIKDIANIRGVRENQLIGYGLVVGLNGTGDGKDEFTSKSFSRMLDTLGVKLSDQQIESKNVAAVIVTATLPAFARAGNKLDVSVHSIGSASSLQGGTLLETPLKVLTNKSTRLLKAQCFQVSAEVQEPEPPGIKGSRRWRASLMAPS